MPCWPRTEEVEWRRQPAGPPGHRPAPRRHPGGRHQLVPGRLSFRARGHCPYRGIGERAQRGLHEPLRTVRMGATTLAEAVVEAAALWRSCFLFRMLYDGGMTLVGEDRTGGLRYKARTGGLSAGRQLDTYEKAGFGDMPVLSPRRTFPSLRPSRQRCAHWLAASRSVHGQRRACRLRLPGQRGHADHARPIVQPGRRAYRHRRGRQRRRPVLRGASMAIDFTLLHC